MASHVFLLLTASLVAAALADGAIVETVDGPVRGVVEERARVFRGIRYAANAAETRWQNPVPPTKWTKTLDATKDGPGCPQVCTLPTLACPSVQSEDCLYLNVFTPLSASTTDLKPVMVSVFVRCVLRRIRSHTSIS